MRRYRVFVERHQSGWLEVSAPDAESARHAAIEKAEYDWYPSPTADHFATSECEMVEDAIGERYGS